MRRALVLAGLALLCASCGGHKAAPKIVTGSSPGVAVTNDPSLLPVVLDSTAGPQRADVRSTCDRGPCPDASSYAPVRMSVVRPGELVTLRVPGATSMRARCRGRRFGFGVCYSGVDILPLGCDLARPLDSIRFSRTPTSWRVLVKPGRYQLAGRIYYTDRRGRPHGQLVSLGLLVDAGRAPRVVDAPKRRGACPT